MLSFQDKIREVRLPLKKSRIEILQINLGKLCNLSCSHCHVEAGPSKTKENMDKKTAEAVIGLMDQEGIHTVDLTGGAPELNPYFRWLVMEARKRNLKVIDRCNLTVFWEEGQEDLAEFLASQKVEIVASLPCYSRDNVDKQRGNGTFSGSIEALLFLNQLGYGQEDSDLTLNLVYNPVGSHLPPSQKRLEGEYKKRLKEDFGIVFNHLFTITNMPITRYEKYLKAKGEFDVYQELLVKNFNSSTIDGLMCRNTLSISWDGKIYDCDFNQALNMQMRNGKALTIFDLDLRNLENQSIQIANHCYGCTAGSGSSCQGEIARESLIVDCGSKE